MAFTSGSIADGQVASSKTTMYTVPASTKAYLKSLSIFNDNAATQTCIIYIKRSGGTSRKYRQFVLAQNESADVFSPGTSLELSTGDIIEGITTTASAVDWVLAGVLET